MDALLNEIIAKRMRKFEANFNKRGDLIKQLTLERNRQHMRYANLRQAYNDLLQILRENNEEIERLSNQIPNSPHTPEYCSD